MKILFPIFAVAACMALASFVEACDRGQLRSQLCDDYGSQQLRQQVVVEYVPVQRQVVEYVEYAPQQVRRQVVVQKQRSQRQRLFQGRSRSRSRQVIVDQSY